MNDRSVIALGSVAHVQTGPFGSQLHSADYVDDGTPIITVDTVSKTKYSILVPYSLCSLQSTDAPFRSRFDPLPGGGGSRSRASGFRPGQIPVELHQLAGDARER